VALARVLLKEHRAPEAKQVVEAVWPMLSAKLPATDVEQREAAALLSQCRARP